MTALQRDDDLVGYGRGTRLRACPWGSATCSSTCSGRAWSWSPTPRCGVGRRSNVGTGWPAWVALFFLEDLSYYVFHRVHHESRFFWASHVVHHSSQRYNLSTALRQTWTPMTGIAFWAPLALLGFHPWMVLTEMSVSLLYQFWIHTEAIDRLPRPVELVFNTPSHHRVHHASNPQYLDRNYAGILIVWDRLFGTFEPEVERPVYGLTTNIATYNPARIAFHEFAAIFRDVRAATCWRDRLGHAFFGPGWRPAPAATTDAA